MAKRLRDMVDRKCSGACEAVGTKIIDKYMEITLLRSSDIFRKTLIDKIMAGESEQQIGEFTLLYGGEKEDLSTKEKMCADLIAVGIGMNCFSKEAKEDLEQIKVDIAAKQNDYLLFCCFDIRFLMNTEHCLTNPNRH